MRVVDILAKEVIIITEFSMREIVMIDTILNNMTFDYNGDNPDHAAAQDYLINSFNPMIKELMKEHGTKTS